MRKVLVILFAAMILSIGVFGVKEYVEEPEAITKENGYSTPLNY
ncbi:hypothetical protein [Oceanobacillus piezotolerans]|nr:hypothetical protein [Oceanobacillus piezotolerans]